MEPPSAAAYFFHLKFLSPRSALFIFICILQRSSSRFSLFPFLPLKKKRVAKLMFTHVHAALSSLPNGSRAQTMCRLWGYQRVPFIVLLRRDFYTNFARCTSRTAHQCGSWGRHHLATLRDMKYCQYLETHASLSLLLQPDNLLPFAEHVSHFPPPSDFSSL